MQTTSGVWQPSPLTNAYWTALSLKINWPGQEADHLPAARTGVKNEWSYTSTPPYAIMALTETT